MTAAIRIGLISAFMGLLAVPSAAQADSASHKGHLSIDRAVVVGNQPLAPGEYQLRWQEHGNTADVSIVEGNKVLVTTTAQVVTLPSKADGDITDTRADGAGRIALVETRFSGQEHALRFGDIPESGR